MSTTHLVIHRIRTGGHAHSVCGHAPPRGRGRNMSNAPTPIVYEHFLCEMGLSCPNAHTPRYTVALDDYRQLERELAECRDKANTETLNANYWSSRCQQAEARAAGWEDYAKRLTRLRTGDN